MRNIKKNPSHFYILTILCAETEIKNNTMYNIAKKVLNKIPIGFVCLKVKEADA